MQRSPPSLLTTAACSGLRPEPDCRPLRTFLHLSYSYASPFGPAILVTHDPKRPSERRSPYGCYETFGRHADWRSLRLDVGHPDHLGPLFSLGGDRFPEFGGCHRHRVNA